MPSRLLSIGQSSLGKESGGQNLGGPGGELRSLLLPALDEARKQVLCFLAVEGIEDRADLFGHGLAQGQLRDVLRCVL